MLQCKCKIQHTNMMNCCRSHLVARTSCLVSPAALIKPVTTCLSWVLQKGKHWTLDAPEGQVYNPIILPTFATQCSLAVPGS